MRINCSAKHSYGSLFITVMITLTLYGISIPAPVLASAVYFSEWKATSGPFQSTGISTFYSGDTAYAWTKAFNGWSERIKIKTAFYRIDPDTLQTFLGEKEQEIDPGNTSEILMEIRAIPQNPAYGYYNYSINYYAYKAGTGDLLEQGDIAGHTLYRVESGARQTILRIQFLDASYKPVSSASVYVDGSHRGYSDVSGYLMLNVSPVTHTIRVQKEGYNDVTETIYDIIAGQINDVKLYQKAPHAPHLTDPADVITEGSTTFRWEISSAADLYQIQVSGTSDFSEKVLDTSSYSNCYSTILNEGNYYWRVRARNDFDLSPWSSTRSLKVIPREIKCSVHFYTNPSTGFITFAGADIGNGTVEVYPYGSYPIYANGALGYTFSRWTVNGNISISNFNSPSSNADIRGSGICTITANFNAKDGGDAPELFVTNAPDVTVRPGEETAFPVNLTNNGKFCTAELWFKSLPEGVAISDKGGLKTMDAGGSASFNVKVKVNQTVKEGNYVSQVAGEAKNATHNWQALILRVVTEGKLANQTSSSTATPAPPENTATPDPSPALQPETTPANGTAATPSARTRTVESFNSTFAIIATITAIYVLRRRGGKL